MAATVTTVKVRMSRRGLNTPAVARTFDVHPLTVRRWIADGNFAAALIGRSFTIDPDSFATYMLTRGVEIVWTD